MGLFDFMKKKKNEAPSEEEKILQGAESAGVVVPDHAKPKEGEAKKSEAKKSVSKKQPSSVFRITGVYAVGGDVMLSGVVEQGIIRKKMKTKIRDKESTVLDIKIGTSSVKELLLREEGTIFLRGKSLFLVRTEDLLEFK